MTPEGEPHGASFPASITGFGSTTGATRIFTPAIIDTIPADLVVIDRDYHIMLTNRPARDWLRLSTDEIRGQKCHKIFRCTDAEVAKCPAITTFKTGETARAVHSGIDTAGRSTHIELTTHPVSDLRGEVVYVMEYRTDLSARVLYEQEILAKNKRLAALNAIAEIAGRSLDLDELLKLSLAMLVEVTAADGGSVMLLDNAIKAFVLRSHLGLSKGFVAANDRIPQESGDALLWTAAWSGMPTVANDLKNDSLARVEDVAEGIESLASVPLRSRTGVVGVINVIRRDNRAFAPEDIELLAAAGSQLGAAIDYAGLAQSLRDSEALYRTVVEASRDVIWFMDRAGTIGYFNRRGKEICGYDLEDLSGKPFAPVIVPKDLPVAESAVARALAGHAQSYEVGVIRKDGEVVELLVDKTPIFVADQVVGTVSFGRDITERKRAEKALQDSERRYRELFEHAGMAIFQSALDGKLLAVNPECARMFGYESPEELLANVVSGTDLFANPDRRAEIVRLIAGRPALDGVESLYRRKDGTTFLGRLRLRSVLDSEGNTVYFEGFSEDITERKQMEEQLVRSKRLEVAGQIAGQVAHDFNNLLTPMTAYPELVRMELPAGHPIIRYIDQIESAAMQMASINEDLLTLSRRGHFNQAPMTLNGLVKQALMQMPSPPNTIVIELDLATDLLPISGSATQLLRVVTNLIANSRDAMFDIGSLRVKTENVYLDNDRSGFDRVKVGEYVRLQIQDTGCGMSVETRERIFEPFFTTKAANRRRGTGLGLSVVQSIVQDHYGLMDVTSQMGAGTTFSLYFPICREAVKVEPDIEVHRGSESILIVDDDIIQQEVAGAILKTIGYSVDAVSSGEKAVAYLLEKPVDLVLLDMVMPGGMDGLETYARIKEIRPEQRVIIVSGYAESERVRKAQDLGVGSFLPKPINLQKLAKAVRDELDQN
ncbi:MAG: PAS domain S-box protein [Dehalococcoidia bacterium]|nr:PAS domain S-box protein [Dehalococcoidia bacterium]